MGEWCADPAIAGARQAVEADVVAHLARRVPDAEAVAAGARRLRRFLDRHTTTTTGCYRLTLEWREGRARVGYRSLKAGELPGVRLADGATACLHSAALAQLTLPEGPIWCDLGVRRPAEADFDLDPGGLQLPAEPAGFLSAVAALGTGFAAGRHPEAGCAAAGAAGGQKAEADYRAVRALARPLTAREAAEAFADYQRAIGGDFDIEEASADHAVVTNRTCPFGTAASGADHLCRVTSAMLGSLGARNAGEASVSVDERLALGDRRCRLTLRLGATPTDADHHYRWPPPKPLGFQPRRDPEPPGVDLSLRLRRDGRSVPFVRHLVRHALRELGVPAEEVADVELAVSEACTNVLRHAALGDEYRVSVAVRGECCEVQIADTGRGFKAASVEEPPPGTEAERGRGLPLMREVMDQVDLSSRPQRGTLVTLTKQLTFPPRSAGRSLLFDRPERLDRPLP